MSDDLEPVAEPAMAGDDAADAGGGLDEVALRDLIVRAHPDVVPELIRGATLPEMLASLPDAQAAYARIAAATGAAPASPVPAGGGVRSALVNIEHLSPQAKIRQGLDRRG